MYGHFAENTVKCAGVNFAPYDAISMTNRSSGAQKGRHMELPQAAEVNGCPSLE
jgi:hypothetical protein